MTSDPIGSSTSTNTAQRFVLGSFYCLVVYFGAISLIALDSIRLSSFIIWLLQVAPLLPFAWGIHKQYQRSYLWLSLVVLLYFMHGVLVAFDPARLWQGLIQIALCAALFIALLYNLRQSTKNSE